MELYAFALAVCDRRTPLVAKVSVWLLIGYEVSPIDPIPDIIPGLGYLDELLAVPLGITLARRLIPEEVISEHRERTDGDIDVGAIRWIVAGVIVLFWLVIGAGLVRLFLLAY